MTKRGTLYIIPTSISEAPSSLALPEYTLNVIRDLEVFYVEDPKTARAKLRDVDMKKPIQEIKMITVDEHTKKKDLFLLIEPLMQGLDAGLISEAGTPAVADPGANIILLAHKNNISVKPLIGPSAITIALSASGLNGQSFAFIGYIPVDKEQRIKRLKELDSIVSRTGESQIFIEAPYRNFHVWRDILDNCHPDTHLSISADLTSEKEYVKTARVGDWSHMKWPDINKRPAIFILGKG